jgi:hypothetical protein
MTEFIIWVFFQWFSQKKIAQLAPPMSKKSCDKFHGESWRAPVGTLGGAAFRVARVTTLGGCGALWDAGLTWIYLVWYWRFSGEVTVGCTCDCGCLLAADLMDAGGMTGASAFLNFLVKISAKVASADLVSSPMAAKGISGCGCFKASVMSWAAMSTRSVEDICGIGEL